MLKGGIRILAIEDAPFKRSQEKDLIVGVIGRQELVEGILSSYVAVDGDDATDRILKMVKKSRFRDQIALIALNGVTLAGLNLVDIVSLSKQLKMPIIAITRKRPHENLLAAAIKKYGNKKKLATLQSVNKKIEIERYGGYYIQIIGIDKKTAMKMLQKCVELLRLAHITASGVTTGESTGRI